MAKYDVTSGVTSTGITLDQYDSMFVSSGGTANTTTVNSGGSMTVLAEGTADSTTVNSGGRMDVKGPGVANYTMVEQYGSFCAYSGGTMNYTTVHGSAATLNSGSVANDTTVLFGGNFRICSGTANTTTVNYNGSAVVDSGGTANSITVNSKGFLRIDPGGTANGIFLNSGGFITVKSGGTATEILEDGGYIDMDSGAVAAFISNTMENPLFSGTSASLHSCTTAYNAQVKYSGALYVYGGKASNTTVSLNAVIYVSGGAVTGTTVDSDGYMHVESGGTANSTTVNAGGWAYVHSGGVLAGIILSSGGLVTVHSGGTAASTTLYADGGKLNVGNGGVAKNTVVSSGAFFTLFDKGAVASDTTVCEGGTLRVSHGGTVDVATINSGYMTVAQSGTAKDVTINADGLMTLLEGGVATGAAVDSDGILVVSYGGVARNATIRSGGTLHLRRGSFLNSMTVNSGGTAYISGTVFVSEFVVNGEIQVTSSSVMSQGIGGGFTLGNGGRLTITEGAIVDGVIVKSGASVMVENGGTLETAGISAAKVTAHAGALLDGVFLNSGGILMVASGAVLEDVCVSSGAVLTGVLHDPRVFELTFSGGTLDLNIAKSSENDGFLVDGGAYTQIKSDAFACTLTVSNQQLNGTYKLIEAATGFDKAITVQNAVGGKLGTLTVNGGPTDVGNITCDLKLTGGDLVVTVTGGAIPDPIYSGGTLIDERKDITSGMSAIEVNVSSGGILNIYSDGVASITTVFEGGVFNVFSGGITKDTHVIDGAMFIYDDVTARNVAVDGGTLVIESGAYIVQTSKGKVVTSNIIVKNGGKLTVNGGWVEGALVSGGEAVIESDGSMFDASVANGSVQAKDGAYAGMTILDGGVMVVESGGTAEGAVSSGGTIRLEDGCDLRSLTVNSGGVLTGVMHGVTQVVKMFGGTLDFDISGAAPSGEFLFDMDANIDIDHGCVCTLTVDGAQANGTYNLMEYAWGYDTQVITAESPLTVKSTGGATLGTLTLNETVDIGGVTYTLNLSNDYHLTVTISDGSPTPPPAGDKQFFAGDFNGDLFDTLAVQKDSTVTIYQNGEAWGLGLTLDTGWTVVGTGDFNGDNLDDFLRVNTEGYVVGEMSNGNGTFSPQVLNLKNAGWDILGTGNFDGVGPDDVLIANPTAASETVGLLGYWKGGTEWTLINGYSPEWTMVSTGDFNGDGKCDMLWKNEFIGEGGLTYNAYCTWIVEDPVDWRMVSVANPDEWNFLCSGDFDGNGSHDIAMINNVGVVGIWGVTDGYLSSWSILSAVTSEWTLAGVADFNADGTDDIAWSNTDTGLTGYWQINNKELTTWANIAAL